MRTYIYVCVCVCVYRPLFPAKVIDYKNVCAISVAGICRASILLMAIPHSAADQ